MSNPNSPNSVNTETKPIDVIEIMEENTTGMENNGKTDLWLSKKTALKKLNSKSTSNSKMLWKLVRMKYIPRLEFRLCRTCSNILFHSTTRVVEREDTGGVKISFELCKQCVNLNMMVKDILCDWTSKKTNEQEIQTISK